MTLSLKKRAWAATFLIALYGPFIGAAQAQTVAAPLSKLPTLGDGSDLSSSAERRLGDRIARELYRDPDYLDDAVLSEYVQGIWQPLLAAARLRGDLSPELDERFSWEILLGRDRTVNAFALPGGNLGLHLGLIAVVSSRDELASVLGHELSHVTQRHISRLIARQGQQAPWLIGAMILGALAASKNADAGNALIVGGQAVSAQNQLNFSRDMEREADRVGFGVMTQAGFEAQGFVAMFDKLQQASRLNDNGAYPYLRSHPLTTERIADMQARQILAPAGALQAAPSTEHALMAQRARVLSNPGVDALRAIAQEAQGTQFSALPPAKQAGVLYGAALANSRLRAFEQARTDLQRLGTLVRTDAVATRWVHLLSVEVALASGERVPAAALLAGPAGGAPGKLQRPELLLAAQAVAQAPGGAIGPDLTSLNQVSQALQTWVQAHPRDAQAWQLLSDAYARQNQPLRSIRASAESQVALLDYSAALDRFNAAQNLAKSNSPADHIDASIIDTRKRQVELLLKELPQRGF